MIGGIRGITFASCLVSALPLPATAQCPPFHDALEDADSILSAGGTITGTLAFAPAVNGQGAYMSGDAFIHYAGGAFNSSAGSVSLWFRKTAPDEEGGILQIGILGTSNSLGIFYNFQDDLFFEVRNSLGEHGGVSAPGVLSTVEYTHIAASWKESGGLFALKLFVNGRYVAGSTVAGPLALPSTGIDVGRAGTHPWYGFARGVVDELAFFDWALHDSEVYGEYVYSSLRFERSPTAKPISTGSVQIINKTLWVAGAPFTIRGVGYQPVPVGFGISRATLDYIYTDACIIARDVPLLRDLGVNTVRFWSELPDSEVLLDALYNEGVDPIYAIMGFWIPADGLDYSDADTIAGFEVEFAAYVNRFKNHPGVLAWGLGNENNLVYAGDLADWYALANRLSEIAYLEEGAAYHPTILINGGMLDFADTDLGSDDASLEYVDMWGHNTYFGIDSHCYFDYFDRLSQKPLVFTEFGIDAYDMLAGQEYPTVHADWVAQQWEQIAANCLGGSVMAYSDEWWKAGDPITHDEGGYYTDQHPDGFSNEEWWGIVAVEDLGGPCDDVVPRLAYYALRDAFDVAGDEAGDFDGDGDVDDEDHQEFIECFTGPGGGPIPEECAAGDFDLDDDVDCDDWREFQAAWSGLSPPPVFQPCMDRVPIASTIGTITFGMSVFTLGAAVVRRRMNGHQGVHFLALVSLR